MLDIDATRRNFNAWVRSPAFDVHFNSVAKAPVWPFIVGPLLIFSLVGIPFGIGLSLWLLFAGLVALFIGPPKKNLTHES